MSVLHKAEWVVILGSGLDAGLWLMAGEQG